jgi:2-C-methyl-D-erythritol 4-phosphate cytidylyltransferase
MNVAIVVAGGKGTRFGGDRPKQFLELNGIPVIVHTLLQFERCREIAGIVVVLPREEVAGFQPLIENFALKKIMQVVSGGETRAQSVRRGLEAIANADIIAVHDGVRPLVTPQEIDAVVKAAKLSGAAILGTPTGDTIKEVDHDRVTGTLPRAKLRRSLTPQCFRFDILKRAFAGLAELESSGADVTDDSFLVERLGIEVVMIEGSTRNLKITNEEDLLMAEALLRSVASG